MLIVFFFSPANTSAELPGSNQVLRKIVFGSCVKQDLPTPIFYTMSGEFPDLILFLGDNIYADTEDMTEMRAKYDRLESNADFRDMYQGLGTFRVTPEGPEATRRLPSPHRKF